MMRPSAAFQRPTRIAGRKRRPMCSGRLGNSRAKTAGPRARCSAPNAAAASPSTCSRTGQRRCASTRAWSLATRRKRPMPDAVRGPVTAALGSLNPIPAPIIDYYRSPRHPRNLAPLQKSCRCQPAPVGEGKWRRKRKREANLGGFGRCSRRAWHRQNRAGSAPTRDSGQQKTGLEGRFLLVHWWSGGGSNSRPSHCERDALPAELPPHVKHSRIAALARPSQGCRTAGTACGSRGERRAAAPLWLWHWINSGLAGARPSAWPRLVRHADRVASVLRGWLRPAAVTLGPGATDRARLRASRAGRRAVGRGGPNVPAHVAAAANRR